MTGQDLTTAYAFKKQFGVQDKDVAPAPKRTTRRKTKYSPMRRIGSSMLAFASLMSGGFLNR